eukprot:TRINITY_DN19558_c1_g1_i1.p2 TRINITY_DN19558_c1_g1~~TRINITY_DN19558_c1_g1_i1.p2  ORF type:complete len:128 (-),score=15.38 TRINITY_DN19558_c1_g1_i1:5-388(-)
MTPKSVTTKTADLKQASCGRLKSAAADMLNNISPQTLGINGTMYISQVGVVGKLAIIVQSDRTASSPSCRRFWQCILPSLCVSSRVFAVLLEIRVGRCSPPRSSPSSRIRGQDEQLFELPLVETSWR